MKARTKRARMVYLTVRISEEMKRQLEERAKATRRTVSQHGFFAIEKYLARKDGKQ